VALYVGVIGAGRADDDVERVAEEVGRLLAEAGAVVVCGGLHGVMAGVARGVRRAGDAVARAIDHARHHEQQQQRPPS
jgi:uncharacterized protein (TIGR00725 family)